MMSQYWRYRLGDNAPDLCHASNNTYRDDRERLPQPHRRDDWLEGNNHAARQTARRLATARSLARGKATRDLEGICGNLNKSRCPLSYPPEYSDLKMSVIEQVIVSRRLAEGKRQEERPRENVSLS